MKDFSINVNVTPSLRGPTLKVAHVTQKKESANICIFQGVGLLYQLVDELVYQQPQYGQVAAVFFISRLPMLGFQEETGQILLSAHNWGTRMRSAWYLLNKNHQTIAQELDYKSYQNFWTTLEFCKPGWSAEVEKWMLDDDSTEVHVEFMRAN
ncbi:hypothetical protein [Pseudomonas fluorescens]|uniref:Uncharacterized protein n=1 Tax=Pseudomonas fluorescens TaxID=294 RepID=A0A0F4V6G5_PSEFL|nr:hypothetical protein [Pseudomonas fluorescens]KJZ64401.1 hypothetical protein VD17_18215 [Pseudomonas fluorescens]